VFKRIQEKVELQNNTSENLHFMEVPFRKVEEFDYVSIAKEINDLKPNYIWVSLGAPKQELFMSNLLPHINQGAMLGVGAALNYFTGQVKDIPNWAKKLHLIWLYRIFTEPKKQLKRCKEIAIVLPKMYTEEKKLVSKQG
jgi:N-acetylglucosaminyldiphosphoundecaprenol N-acetyl-beta-D-mannosaminyltransferase